MKIEEKKDFVPYPHNATNYREYIGKFPKKTRNKPIIGLTTKTSESKPDLGMMRSTSGSVSVAA